MDYAKTFVVLTPKSNKKVTINGIANIYAFPRSTSDLAIKTTQGDVEALNAILTSKESWVKVSYVKNNVKNYGYIHGDRISPKSDSDPLLKIIFSQNSPINGVEYDVYWHGAEHVTISGSQRYTNATVAPIPHITGGNNSNETLTPLSQSQLGFLYSMAKEIGEAIEFDNFFERVLAISMHETKMGMAYGTWKPIDAEKGNAAQGYFQCRGEYNQLAADVSDGRYKITNKWNANAIRLDRISGKSESGVDFALRTRYGTIVHATNVLRSCYSSSKANLMNALQKYMNGQNFSETQKAGYNANEFVYCYEQLHNDFVSKGI